MKQLTCEMCGSTDLIKQDGVFICQSCNTKYSVEEARKMMVEGTVEVVGTVKVDNTSQIQNFLVMANNAYKGSNLKEAEDYANKVIEIDPENAEAWLIKGRAAGWQSTIGNKRFGESIDCWQKAVSHCDEEKKQEYKDLVSDEMQSLMIAMVSLCTKNFANYPSTDNAQEIISTLQSNTNLALKFLLQIGIASSGGTPGLTDDSNEKIARLLNDAAISGFHKANKDFGPSNSDRHKYAYTSYLEYVSNCITIMRLAMTQSRTEETISKRCESYVTFQNTIINSKSFKFEPSSYTVDHYVVDTGLSAGAIASRREDITKTQAKRDEMIKKITDKKEAERKAAADKYWGEHPEEKTALDSEKEQLTGETEQYTSQLAAIPDKAEAARIETIISGIEAEKNSLGVFKVKEKKALQEKIDLQKADLQKAYGRVNAAAMPIVEKLNAAKRRIAEIDDRLFNAK